MTQTERENVEEYGRLFPGCCCQANQNPRRSREPESEQAKAKAKAKAGPKRAAMKKRPVVVCTRANNYMFCIVKSHGLHHSHHHRRWLSGSEVLLANGFPVLRSLADPGYQARWARLCSYALGGSSIRRKARTRTQKVAQSGDAINVPSIGFVLLYAILFSKPVAELSIAARVFL